MGPVDDLPGAARVMASERGLITGILSGEVGAGTGLGTLAGEREGLVRWKRGCVARGREVQLQTG